MSWNGAVWKDPVETKNSEPRDSQRLTSPEEVSPTSADVSLTPSPELLPFPPLTEKINPALYATSTVTLSEGDAPGRTILMRSLSGPTSRPIIRLKTRQLPKGKKESVVYKELCYTTQQLKEFANSSKQKSMECVSMDPKG